MRKFNKKGFTIVELVIVIAVIAILAGVLIPTFSGIVEKANESKALQEVKNAYTVYVADELTDNDSTDPETKIWVVYNTFKIKITDGKAEIATENTMPQGYVEYEVDTKDNGEKTLDVKSAG